MQAHVKSERASLAPEMRSACLRFLRCAVAASLVSGCAADRIGPELINNRDSVSAAPNLADQLAAQNDLATSAALYLQQARVGGTASARTRAFLGLGDVLLRGDRPREAAGAYRAALREDPSNAAAEMGLGVALLTNGEPEAAIEALKRAVSRGDDRAYAALGAAYDVIGDTASAEAAYTAGVESRPGDLAVRSNWALSLALRGLAEEATRQARTASDDPFAKEVHRHNLVLVHAILDDDITAREQARAMRLDTDETEQTIAIGRSLAGLSHEKRREKLLLLLR